MKKLLALAAIGLILAGSGWWVRGLQLRAWHGAAVRLESRLAEFDFALAIEKRQVREFIEKVGRLESSVSQRLEPPTPQPQQASDSELRQELDDAKAKLDATREELDRLHGMSEAFDQARDAEVDLVVFRVADEILKRLPNVEAERFESYQELVEGGKARPVSHETIRTLIWPRETILGEEIFGGGNQDFFRQQALTGFSSYHVNLHPVSLMTNHLTGEADKDSAEGVMVPGGLERRTRGSETGLELFSKDDAVTVKFSRSDWAEGSGLFTIASIEKSGMFQRLGAVAVSPDAGIGKPESDVVFIRVREP